MSNFEVNKQGIEIETQQIDKVSTKSKYVNGLRFGPLTDIHHGFHQDDGKVEFSSEPFANLGDMESHLRVNYGAGLREMAKDFYPITMGCTPFFFDFASGHVHTSTKGMTEGTWVNLRQKLFSAQPLIDLLSQNSPIVGSVRAADVRLLLSNWSTFTDFDSKEEAHWFAVAYGMKGQTIEVRIPSSGPLFQLLAVAAMIRVVIEDDGAAIALPDIKTNWSRVINYGSSSISRVAIPSSLRYDGFKQKDISVKTTDLWKVFYEDYAEPFDKILNQLSTPMKNDIKEFYKFIANGHTLSDSYYAIIDKMVTDNKETDIARVLSDITIKSYSGGGAFDILPSNPDPFMPIIEKFLSIKEMKDICTKLRKPDIINRFNVIDNDIANAFLDGINGITSNPYTSDLILRLRRGDTVAINAVNANSLRCLVTTNIAQVVGNNITKGTNFNIAVALAKEAGVI
jgi:hypothetical protein